MDQPRSVMGNKKLQEGCAPRPQPHLLKLLRLAQPIGQEGLCARGYEVDGESEEAQLEDSHVVFAQLCGVV